MDQEFDVICNKLLETHKVYTKKVRLENERAKLPSNEAKEKDDLAAQTREKSERIIEENASNLKNQPRLPKTVNATLPEHPKKHGCKTKTDVILGGVLGLLMYASFLLIPFVFIFFIIIFIVGACVAVWVAVGRKRASIVDYDQRWAAYQKQLDKWEADMRQAEAQNSDFLEKWNEYDKSFFDFVGKTDKMQDELRYEYNMSYVGITDKYAKMRDDIVAEINRCAERLEAIGILAPRYYYLAHDVYDVLSTGRADSLKEALNIAIDDERKARDEAERRAAERRQESILQNQADETFRHQQRMENEARAMAQDARNHQYEMERETKNYHKDTYAETVRHNREMENMFRR